MHDISLLPTFPWLRAFLITITLCVSGMIIFGAASDAIGDANCGGG